MVRTTFTPTGKSERAYFIYQAETSTTRSYGTNVQLPSAGTLDEMRDRVDRFKAAYENIRKNSSTSCAKNYIKYTFKRLGKDSIDQMESFADDLKK
jgi:hypothetical protein